MGVEVFLRKGLDSELLFVVVLLHKIHFGEATFSDDFEDSKFVVEVGLDAVLGEHTLPFLADFEGVGEEIEELEVFDELDPVFVLIGEVIQKIFVSHVFCVELASWFLVVFILERGRSN